jgi:hypothetical protein
MKKAEFRRVFLALEPQDFEALDDIVRLVNENQQLNPDLEARMRRLKAAGLIFEAR